MKNIFFAKTAILAAFLYQILLIILILLRPDLPVYSTTISEWAIGNYGWLMQIAFFISAFSYLFLFLTLKKEINGIVGKIGLTLLFISFIGTMGVGVFITDPYPPDFTITKTLLHTISGTLAMLFFPISILLISLNISKKNDTWNTNKSILKSLGFIPLLAFVGFNIHLAMFVFPLGEGAVGENVPIGFPPRIMFLLYHITLIAIAYLFIKKEQLKIK